MRAFSSLQSPFSRTAILLLTLAAITGFVVACAGHGEAPVELRFELASSSANRSIAVRSVRVYLHQIELITADGQTSPIKLVPSNWQNDQVALLDFGTSAKDGNTLLKGVARHAGYTGLRFTVGVPFASNHANPLTALAPLNRADLFWSWASGYKFMRIDLAERQREWSFHLGSTGCSSASALRPPAAPCAQPNLVRVELRGFDPTQQPVRLQLDPLIDAMRAASFQVCTGDYQHNPSCAVAYNQTGLNVANGTCSDGICSKQQLFGIQ